MHDLQRVLQRSGPAHALSLGQQSKAGLCAMTFMTACTRSPGRWAHLPWEEAQPGLHVTPAAAGEDPPQEDHAQHAGQHDHPPSARL